MNYYGARDIAASFRTVRNNTLKIAEEIPEDKYGFRAAEGTRTIGQTLIHISNIHKFLFAVLRDKPAPTLEGFNFMEFIGPLLASEQEPMTKAQIIERVRVAGEDYENWAKGLSEEFLGKVLTMPPGGNPPSRSHFDMVIAVKEHEMHLAGN